MRDAVFVLVLVVGFFAIAAGWEGSKPCGKYPVGTVVRIPDSAVPWVVRRDLYSHWTKNRTYQLYYAPADVKAYVHEEELKLWGEL